jgi:hypothetical protein
MFVSLWMICHFGYKQKFLKKEKKENCRCACTSILGKGQGETGRGSIDE